MKGDAAILTLLNELLTNELTAINQYLIHSKLCAHTGYHRLAAKFHEESLDELAHAEAIIARILFLDGEPNLARYHELGTGKTVREQLEDDLKLELAAIQTLNTGITAARAAKDNASEDLMTKILVAEENGVDWIETQLELIRQIGEQNYLAQQLK
jgi:bacterioferritin